MNKSLAKFLCGALLFSPAMAMAEFSESYNFLKAVRERDGAEATKMVTKPGSIIINTHDSNTGETALTIVTREKDFDWLRFLLSKGADVDGHDKKGDTPLLIATRLSFEDGAKALIAYHANVNASNNVGENALIIAVQQHSLNLVKLLLAEGANPEKTDHSTGRSAHDYARLESRFPEILRVIESAHAAAPKPKQGPSL